MAAASSAPRAPNPTFWSRFFLVAALFNYVIGLPILFARRWTYNLTYAPDVTRDVMALRLWMDFGFSVVLIGIGYHLVSRDVTQNRGIVLLGILAKLFDVINLSTLYAWGVARPLALVPAVIDGSFALGFAWFWWLTRPPTRKAE